MGITEKEKEFLVLFTSSISSNVKQSIENYKKRKIVV